MHSPASASPLLCPEDLWSQTAVDTGRGHQRGARPSTGRPGSCDWRQGVELTSCSWRCWGDTGSPEPCVRAHVPAASKTQCQLRDTVSIITVIPEPVSQLLSEVHNSCGAVLVVQFSNFWMIHSIEYKYGIEGFYVISQFYSELSTVLNTVNRPC